MGRISKAIKLKLQELRIDEMFKEKILKYKNDGNKEKHEDNASSNDECKEIREDNYNSDINTSTEENNRIELDNRKDEYKKLNIEDVFEEVTKDFAKTEIKEEKLKISLSENVELNETIMQYFEWYYPNDGSLWKKIKEDIKELKDLGITALWLPPACKAADGINDAGYGIYDLYDLGEFDQKGTVRTKYGTKEEYLAAIKEAQKNNIKIYGDVVFNHKGGADESEIVPARPVAENNRNEFIGEKRDIGAHTVFYFPGRGNTYSDYKWSAKDFDGVDFDEITKQHGIFKFEGKEWEKEVDSENGNYDFLMFADLDLDSPDVIEELKRWGKWYFEQTNVDGFRLDAIKHIKFDFFNEWLKYVRGNSKKELFAVGEYWTHDVNKLKYYMDRCENCMSLFDVPLHFNFQKASTSFGYFDMRNLANNTLLTLNPDKAVTFVDNHDTQFGQALESWVQPWFKPSAYTFILTRQEGYPCVFYGDYYGIPKQQFWGLKDKLDVILRVRKNYAYGIQHDYMDDNSIVGWTREGDNEHINSGLASLITINSGGSKKMYVGHQHKGEIWIDATKQSENKIIIDDEGFGIFNVKDGSYAIWIKD